MIELVLRYCKCFSPWYLSFPA